MEEIGRLCGVSKMAVSKRLRKLHGKAEELCHMTGLPGFFLSLGLLFTSSASVHTGWEQNFFKDFSFSGLQTASKCPNG